MEDDFKYPSIEEMSRVVAERIKTDPEFAAQCEKDIEDFFKPSPVLEALRRKLIK